MQSEHDFRPFQIITGLTNIDQMKTTKLTQKGPLEIWLMSDAEIFSIDH